MAAPAPAPAPSGGGLNLGHKIGPFPMWVWIGAAGVGIFLFIRARQNASNAAASTQPGATPVLIGSTQPDNSGSSAGGSGGVANQIPVPVPSTDGGTPSGITGQTATSSPLAPTPDQIAAANAPPASLAALGYVFNPTLGYDVPSTLTYPQALYLQAHPGTSPIGAGFQTSSAAAAPLSGSAAAAYGTDAHPGTAYNFLNALAGNKKPLAPVG